MSRQRGGVLVMTARSRSLVRLVSTYYGRQHDPNPAMICDSTFCAEPVLASAVRLASPQPCVNSVLACPEKHAAKQCFFNSLFAFILIERLFT